MDQAPKHIKRALRELAVRAHEVELERELASSREFSRWRSGAASAFDLSDAITSFTRARRGTLTDLHPAPPKGAIAGHPGQHDRTQIDLRCWKNWQAIRCSPSTPSSRVWGY